MISINNIRISFGDTAVLRNISFKVGKGDFIYIVGPSGAGKTTLLRSLYLDILPDRGWIRIGKQKTLDIKKRRIPYIRRKLGIIFQDYKLLDDRRALDNVSFAARAIGASGKEAKKKALKAIASVGILAKRDNMPSELSGGELQRVCIARAIVNDPIVILADEPTGNLDPQTGRDVFALLKKINESGTAVIVATHNHEIIREFPGRTIFLENGRQVDGSLD